MTNLLRQLPQVDMLLSGAVMAGLAETYSRSELTEALRAELAALRAGIQSGALGALPDFAGAPFADRISARLEVRRRPNLVSLVNATGIIVHTNLGRSRLAPEALAAIEAAGRGHTNLEMDLATGKRGSRHAHVEALICELTGSEAALVVNNCAAAVLLSLMATAQGRKVIASRGELIEIGGSFRLPDIIAQSGAVLKEVGATNKTRAADYAAAVDDDTAVLLKSHTSNYQIVGFTAAPRREDLAALARETRTIFMEDLGSGVLVDLSPYGLKDEPVVSDVIRSGADLVMFSGDKLLGGPQCGIIAGRSDIVRSLKSHPLCRAVRIDKLSLAALEATLRLYRAPNDPFRRIPVLRAIAQTTSDLQARAGRLAAALTAIGLEDVSVVPSTAYVGGGSLPQQTLGSFAVTAALPGTAPDTLAARLRGCSVPVIGRIRDERFFMDVRTLTEEDLPHVEAAFRAVAAQ
ncbi:MAG: L-seryl-tRNA(Sec) selenium transferase [Hyphomonas sp.]|uniref:L-seryl-tRNA(Sec) selenium transferase n=1 Tax=Hyphomonas sp. TaxID=87 RepID=UPI0034A07592